MMTQPIKYQVTVDLNGPLGVRTEIIEILAFNAKQAERKAANQLLNRTDKLVRSKALAV